ncbi:MAG: 2-C-methyl-D-erythritol 2,4-cyclodiphosphate synthase [Planctomycetota bacterium]
MLRVGLGTDMHRLVSGRELRLGGVSIASERGALGHSDADVVLHALADALLGAVGAGDIGELFPDHDPAFRGLDSAQILRRSLAELRKRDTQLVNADIVIELERPKVLPHRNAIRARIAELLECRLEQVFVKAKTAEGMGPVGEGLAIAATAIVLVDQAP